MFSSCLFLVRMESQDVPLLVSFCFWFKELSCFVFFALSQTMPVAMALLRDVQNLCPKDVLNFILDLIKYNDNRKNKVKTLYHTFFFFNDCDSTWCDPAISLTFFTHLFVFVLYFHLYCEIYMI